MTSLEYPPRPARSGRRRLAAVALAGTVAAGALGGAGTAAQAAPVSVTDATLEWDISEEVGHYAPPFGGCNYLSAGVSDGEEGTYQTSAGDVTVLKDGAEPTWADKCDGASGGNLNQKAVWSGGAGTVDPDTGAVELAFTGELSVNFYGGLVPFSIQDPVLTVDPDGTGQIVATMGGYASDMGNPFEKEPIDPVPDVVVANLSGVDSANEAGFTITPDYEGVEYEPPAGSDGPPQNRSSDGWGSWPESFVDFHYITGLGSYWYHSGGAADPHKAPTALTISYDGTGGGAPEPGDGEQAISVTVPEMTEPGEFLWSIDGDRAVDLGEVTDEGAFLQATGAIDPISVTDARTGGPEWSISGQVSDFTGGLSGGYLGWTPQVLTAGAGATAGEVVPSGIDGGDGLSQPSVLAAAPAGHDGGTAALGADLDLRLPAGTEEGSYTATLTITALS